MATDAEIQAGAAALKAYVESIDGWEADFIGDQVYQDGASEVIQAADNAQANLTAAGGAALMASIVAAGYGDRVTQDQCNAGAAAVLQAVDAIRDASKGLA